jgi:Asp-tRNA(Asn)/Glu-tRNA(Gln) amidotransferase A subunit family amidase
MDDLVRTSAVEAAARLARRELSAERYVRAHLERIEEREPQVRAFVHIDAAGVLSAARALDGGPVRGLLHGLPIGVKDIFDTFDMPTQGGCLIYSGHQPAIDAACVALSRRAGALVLGKTVTAELATFAPNETRNPLDPAHTPGGSSSGSAAAVADGMLPLATGTQTWGSIIRPASFCGVVGFKPTYNLIPKKGVWNSADSLDTVGVFGRSVADAALFVAGMLDFRDLLVPGAPAVPRIGICRTLQWERAAAETKTALENASGKLAAAGAVVQDIALPGQYADLLRAQTTVALWETGHSYADECFRNSARLRKALFERCLEGYRIDPAEYQRAIALGRQCRAMLPDAFAGCDVLLAPAAAGEAPRGLDWTGDPLFNQVWTFLHTPCVAIPASHGPNGLPIGLQVVGRLDDDARTLHAAHWIERVLCDRAA